MDSSTTATIYINGRFLTQAITGVQRFAIELTRTLKAKGIELNVVCPQNVLHKDLFQEFDAIVVGHRHGHAWEQIHLVPYLKKRGNPLLLNLCNTAPIRYSKNIVCIHDLAFLHHPEWFKPLFKRYYNFLLPRIAKKSLAIWTVSKTVKKEINAYYHIPIDNIHVLYNGVSELFLSKQKPKDSEGNPRPYLLAIGGSNPRKNNVKLIEALDYLDEHAFDLRIVGRAESNFQKDQLEEKKRNYQIHFHEDITDQLLLSLYQNASALIYLSKYEGFGIPPLEALHQGCPLLLSDIPIFRELYEGLADFVDPERPEQINDFIQGLKAGKIQVPNSDVIKEKTKEFSYSAAAENAIHAIQKLNY